MYSGDISLTVYTEILKAGRIAWDIETNGLDPKQAKIGTCQLYSPEIGAVVVTDLADASPKYLPALLAEYGVLKVFHHAPFDVSFMTNAWGVRAKNVACTKIAAKILSPSAPAEEYSLKHLLRRHFNVPVDKYMRFTNWLSDSLSEKQVEYAVTDVIKLLDLYDLFQSQLARKGLTQLYDECRNFLPSHVSLKLLGCPDPFKY
ncbi:hypothetical protein [Streptomyces sp. AA1529]|uniref:hypothetical protein n=1 Tax=Streptomyces sp. AA1529 TaxID=1203257 RepID=UPI003D752678